MWLQSKLVGLQGTAKSQYPKATRAYMHAFCELNALPKHNDKGF